MADKYIVRTDIGKISVYDNTIREIVAGAAESVSGRAYITNSRGKQARRSSERLKDIEVDVADGRIFVRVYIVIKFGLSIHYVTDKLINGIRDGIHT
ncbi:MAG: Asp23/Gls24 family envelope stress response protein, partial [Anaerovoracaceae bacterium]|nr:Asp23/Gls24 family envelope stress response protein [Anaerovoracaceae bacterium]